MCAVSFATGDFSWTIGFTRYQGALFLILYALWSTVLTARVASGFLPGDRMRVAWLLMLAASALRLASSLIIQLFTHESGLNPIPVFWPGWNSDLRETIFNIGVHLGGPVQYTVLLAGIVSAIRGYRQLGLVRPLRAMDWVISGGLVLHAAAQTGSAYFWATVENVSTGFGWWLGYLTDPLLAAAVTASIIMRRSSALLRGGLLEMSWASMASAVFFTAVGNVCLWAMRADYIKWPYDSLTWLIWYLPAIFYTTAPAYQLQAMEAASGSSRD